MGRGESGGSKEWVETWDAAFPVSVAMGFDGGGQPYSWFWPGRKEALLAIQGDFRGAVYGGSGWWGGERIEGEETGAWLEIRQHSCSSSIAPCSQSPKPNAYLPPRLSPAQES